MVLQCNCSQIGHACSLLCVAAICVSSAVISAWTLAGLTLKYKAMQASQMPCEPEPSEFFPHHAQFMMSPRCLLYNYECTYL